MTDDSRSKKNHDIAKRCATMLVSDCVDAGLEWAEMAVCCETVIAIVVSAMADSSHAPSKIRFAQEIIDTMTEGAHLRAQEAIRRSER